MVNLRRNYLSEEIRRELKEIRKVLGLTQRELAALYNRTTPRSIKTSKTDISRYECGIIDLPASKYKKFLSLKPIKGTDDERTPPKAE